MEMGNGGGEGGSVHRRMENKRHADECGSQAPENRRKGQQQDWVLGLPLILHSQVLHNLTHTRQVTCWPHVDTLS